MAKTVDRQDDAYRLTETNELVGQLEQDFAKRNKLYERIDKIVFSDYAVTIPDAYRKSAMETHSPSASDISNTITSALSINPFHITFRPAGFGDAAQQNATLREHFFEASWERQEREARRRLFRLFMNSLVTKGEGVIKTMERDKRAWSTYTTYSKQLLKELAADDALDQDARDRIYDAKTEEYKRGAPYPIVSTDVPPESFYYVKGEDGFSYCCEIKTIPHYQALRKYGAGLDNEGRAKRYDAESMGLPLPNEAPDTRGGRQLVLVEAWHVDEVLYILRGPGDRHISDGVLVKRVKHRYGDRARGVLRGPYFQAQGITTASRLPERAGLSVLYGFLDLFPLLDAYLTMEHNAAFLFGFPGLKQTRPPQNALPAGAFPAPHGSDGTEREGSEGERWEPGTLFPYDVDFIAPRGSEILDRAIARVQSMLERALPSVVRGAVNDESGYALNQAAHLARLAWDPIVENAEFAMGDRVGFESWLIERRIGEPVYVWGENVGGKRQGDVGWLGVGPDDLKGLHRYVAKLDPETPSTKVVEARYWHERIAQGTASRAQAIEAMGDNPDEVEDAILFEEFKQRPEVHERIMQRTMQKLGLADRKALIGTKGQENLAGGPLGGGGAAPGAQLGNTGQVFQPGQNGMAITPTPNGSVTGIGPGAVEPAQPANHMPLPGEGG